MESYFMFVFAMSWRDRILQRRFTSFSFISYYSGNDVSLRGEGGSGRFIHELRYAEWEGVASGVGGTFCGRVGEGMYEYCRPTQSLECDRHRFIIILIIYWNTAIKVQIQ